MRGVSKQRPLQINIRLSPEDRLRLDMLSAHYGLDCSYVLRMLVKRDVDRIELEAKGKPGKRQRGV